MGSCSGAREAPRTPPRWAARGRGFAQPVAAESRGQRVSPLRVPRHPVISLDVWAGGVARAFGGAPARTVHPVHPVSGALPSLPREPAPFSPEEGSAPAPPPPPANQSGFSVEDSEGRMQQGTVPTPGGRWPSGAGAGCTVPWSHQEGPWGSSAAPSPVSHLPVS